jgi:hypothetical protein
VGTPVQIKPDWRRGDALTIKNPPEAAMALWERLESQPRTRVRTSCCENTLTNKNRLVLSVLGCLRKSNKCPTGLESMGAVGAPSQTKARLALWERLDNRKPDCRGAGGMCNFTSRGHLQASRWGQKGWVLWKVKRLYCYNDSKTWGVVGINVLMNEGQSRLNWRCRNA